MTRKRITQDSSVRPIFFVLMAQKHTSGVAADRAHGHQARPWISLHSMKLGDQIGMLRIQKVFVTESPCKK